MFCIEISTMLGRKENTNLYLLLVINQPLLIVGLFHILHLPRYCTTCYYTIPICSIMKMSSVGSTKYSRTFQCFQYTSLLDSYLATGPSWCCLNLAALSMTLVTCIIVSFYWTNPVHETDKTSLHSMLWNCNLQAPLVITAVFPKS